MTARKMLKDDLDQKIAKILSDRLFCRNCILVFFTFLNESKCFLPSLSDNFMKGSKECNLTAVNTQAIEAG